MELSKRNARRGALERTRDLGGSFVEIQQVNPVEVVHRRVANVCGNELCFLVGFLRLGVFHREEPVRAGVPEVDIVASPAVRELVATWLAETMVFEAVGDVDELDLVGLEACYGVRDLVVELAGQIVDLAPELVAKRYPLLAVEWINLVPANGEARVVASV